MTTQKHFCTCQDTDCKLNPCNHSLGCDPCVRKNLKAGEIPGCFFHLIKDDLSQLDDFTLEGFVQFYLQNKSTK
ncbi:MAG: hypothetical protein K0S22_1274 [Oscillospiraceae bacterium]|jgi:hypothetical protein|nr:hypothetical protein [Oscillospiraceae bacterium]